MKVPAMEKAVENFILMMILLYTNFDSSLDSSFRYFVMDLFISTTCHSIDRSQRIQPYLFNSQVNQSLDQNNSE